MRRGALVVAAGLAVGLALTAPARGQDVRSVMRSPVVVLDQERLFAESAAGQALTDRIEAETAALAAENRRIETELTAEERDLTEQRATLSPEEFRALAEEFDSRVVAIRRAQDTKARALAKRRETAQQQFYRDALPVIAELVGERGAVAVLDRSVVLLSAEQIDITDAVIARIDAKTDTGDRDQQVQPADDAPAPPPGNPDPAAPPVTGTQP